VPDSPPSAPAASAPPSSSPSPARGLAAFAAVLGFFLQVLAGLLQPATVAGLVIPVTALVTGFVLASQIVAEPSHNQIGLLAVYAVFSLALVSILRRKA
jgi:hypothetical protein